jgi:hypothetical protein
LKSRRRALISFKKCDWEEKEIRRDRNMLKEAEGATRGGNKRQAGTN